MLNHKKKTIIFDFDGTLADSIPLGVRIINELSTVFRYRHIAESELVKLRDKTTKELIKEFDIPFYKVPFIAYMFKRKVRERIDEIKLFPGIVEMIREVRQKKYNVGVLTSNLAENAEHVLDKYGILDEFDFVHGEKNIFGKDKALTKLMRKYELHPPEVLYVGDEVRDIEACHAISIDIAAVTWGLNGAEILNSYKPTLLIHNPKELCTIL